MPAAGQRDRLGSEPLQLPARPEGQQGEEIDLGDTRRSPAGLAEERLHVHREPGEQQPPPHLLVLLAEAALAGGLPRSRERPSRGPGDTGRSCEHQLLIEVARERPHRFPFQPVDDLASSWAAPIRARPGWPGARAPRTRARKRRRRRRARPGSSAVRTPLSRASTAPCPEARTSRVSPAPGDEPAGRGTPPRGHAGASGRRLGRGGLPRRLLSSWRAACRTAHGALSIRSSRGKHVRVRAS